MTEATLISLYAARTHIQQSKASLFEMQRELADPGVSEVMTPLAVHDIAQISIKVREVENTITGMILKAEHKLKSNLEPAKP